MTDARAEWERRKEAIANRLLQYGMEHSPPDRKVREIQLQRIRCRDRGSAMIEAGVAEILRVCRAAGVRMHVRDSDDRPVIEFRDRASGRVVGGTEMRRRLASRGIAIDTEKLARG